MKPLVVVTGKNGQLGWELEQIHADHSSEFDFLFIGRQEMDLSNSVSVEAFFTKYQPQYFINCAAYTAVDKAEADKETAFYVNAVNVGLLASLCLAHQCRFISFSTDYVFDGNTQTPYLPDDATNPLNQYGLSKREGEKLALQNNPLSVIIRTSWVYSSHGNNFVKTMLRLMNERPEIKVVADQIGGPTYARDLAMAVIKIMAEMHSGNPHAGIYHYCNSGIISWHQFAAAIQQISGLNCKVLPITTNEYPTPAKRSHYSGLDTSKIVADFDVIIKPWQESLQECLKLLL